MFARRTKSLTYLFAAATLILSAPPLRATGLTVDVVPNFVGLGAGVTTEWMGARDSVGGVVPAARMQLQGNRFIEVYGPFVDVNVLDIPNWEFGPMLSYRFGREDVEDPVVNQLPSISGGLEAGFFGGWHYVNTTGIPWRLRLGVSFLTAVSGGTTGANVTPYMSVWVPLRSDIFFGIGGGFTWSNDSFMQQRFGVTPEAATLSGLPVYTASSGVRQAYAWPAVIVRLSPQWFAGAGAFYQRLTGDAANSPIVTQRGDRNQWTAGIGIAYTWR